MSDIDIGLKKSWLAIIMGLAKLLTAKYFIPLT